MNALISTVVLAVAMFAAPVHAADKGSADEAVAMTKKAVAFLKANGKEKAFAAFANPADTTFHDRDLYVYVYSMDGICVAHGANPKMVGRNLIDMRDRDDKYIIRGFIEAAKSDAGGGWVDYQWPNPVSKLIEHKAGYVEKSGNLIVGSGIYK